MDFLDRAVDFIESNIDLEDIIHVGKLAETDTAISIRPTPSTFLSRSLDNGTTFEYSFQVLVKHTNQLAAINTTNEIAFLFDGLSNGAIKSLDGSFVFVKSEIYTYPNYVETLEHGQTIYTAIIVAELERRK